MNPFALYEDYLNKFPNLETCWYDYCGNLYLSPLDDDERYVCWTETVKFASNHVDLLVDIHLHRLDGPTVIWARDSDGINWREWWIDNNKLPKEKVEIWIVKNDVDLSTEEGQIAFKLMWS